MQQVQFVHTCHIDGVKYAAGTSIDASTLPADWLWGALAQGFVIKVNTAPSNPSNNPGGVPSNPTPESSINPQTPEAAH